MNASFISLIFIALLIQTVLPLSCFNTQYPRILGGTIGSTIFLTVDMDPISQKDLVLGGQTSDSGVASIMVAPDPILLYMVGGGLYKWAISLAGIDLDKVNTVKFNSLGTKINALVVNSVSWYLVIVQPSDGTILKVLSDIQTK